MTSRDFCYWLQGYFELYTGNSPSVMPALSAQQTDCIRRHLALVFAHEIDPSAGDEAHQAELNAIHEAGQAMKEAVKAEVAEVVSKLPKPSPHGPFGPKLRC